MSKESTLKKNVLSIPVVCTFMLVFTQCYSQQPTVAEKNNDEPIILLSPLSGVKTGATLLIINEQDDTLKMKPSDVLATNFMKWEYDGKTRFSYFLEDTTFYKMKGAPYYPGYQVIEDTGLNEIKRVHLLSHKNIDAARQPGIDNHEFILIADNHYIVLAYYEQAPDNIPTDVPHKDSMSLLTPVIQEIKNDKVIWQWVGTDYPELYYNSFRANDSGYNVLDSDYLHVNSMFIDPADNNLIISCRKSNQLLKLNRQNAEIIWRFGGYGSNFSLPDTMQHLRQHHITKTGNTIMLVDNGNKTRPYSRIMEYDINEKKKTITAIRPFVIPGVFTEFGGSVQKMGDSYFIGGGSGAFIMRINYLTNEKTFEKKLPKGTYRALIY